MSVADIHTHTYIPSSSFPSYLGFFHLLDCFSKSTPTRYFYPTGKFSVSDSVQSSSPYYRFRIIHQQHLTRSFQLPGLSNAFCQSCPTTSSTSKFTNLPGPRLLFSFQLQFHALFSLRAIFLSASPPRSSLTLVSSWSLIGVLNTPTSPHPPFGLSTAIGLNIPPGEGMSPTLFYLPRISAISNLSPSI